MKKYEQLTFDRSHNTMYIKNILQNALLNHKDRVYFAYRHTGFGPYIYYMLYDISLAGNRHIIFFGRNLDVNNITALIMSIDMLINKDVRIFVDVDQ